ncbi:MAG: hypothetical protein IT443_00445 [Phycisphaeraceae bacterium]|nr:hypothetical protein [Phycisphaeraceae bacterium]
MPNADCRLPIADCRLPIADCRLPIADCRLPIADCRLPIAGEYASGLESQGEFESYGLKHRQSQIGNRTSNIANRQLNRFRGLNLAEGEDEFDLADVFF